MSICFIDGRWRPTGECCLPVTDLVIQRGVGVFDSIRIYDRRLFALDEHMKRLAQSAAMAGIECGTVVDRLRDIVREGAKRDDYPGNGDCIAKVYITGGDENNFGKFPKPRYFGILEECAAPSQEEYEKGVVVLPTPVGRPYPLMKSVNYLFGMIEHAGRDDMEECLYCPEGEVTETLRSSFFMSRG
ncbi:MAG: aminotransferase class IV, partial [Synergistaceae bacterium]|nr:aminotransferase class IV [Synergistaceae bacterium]